MGDEPTIIYSYTRAQAIADGVLVDVSEKAREVGILYPVAVTAAVWARYVEFPPDVEGQDEAGRLWDVLWMFRSAGRWVIGREFLFKLHVAMVDRHGWQPNESLPERKSGLTRATHRLVTLKAHCGPGDTPEPVITIMLPDED